MVNSLDREERVPQLKSRAAAVADDDDLSGAHEEFLKLFSQYSLRLYQFILTLAMNHADAEEIYQNTCTILWRKFDVYDAEGSFYGWACRMAQLEFLKMRRKNSRMMVLSDAVINTLADRAIAHGEEISATHAALAECLKKLKVGDRDLIEQRYHGGQRPKEIARDQAKSVHAVYRALTRIHDALRECVHRHMAQERAR